MLPDRDSLLLALGIPHGKSPLSLRRGKQLEPSFAFQTNLEVHHWKAMPGPVARLWEACHTVRSSVSFLIHQNHQHPTLEINYYSFRRKILKEFIWTFFWKYCQKTVAVRVATNIMAASLKMRKYDLWVIFKFVVCKKEENSFDKKL